MKIREIRGLVTAEASIPVMVKDGDLKVEIAIRDGNVSPSAVLTTGEARHLACILEEAAMRADSGIGLRPISEPEGCVSE